MFYAQKEETGQHLIFLFQLYKTSGDQGNGTIDTKEITVMCSCVQSALPYS